MVKPQTKTNERRLRNFLINNHVQLMVISKGVIYMLASVAFTLTLVFHRQVRDLVFLPETAAEPAERFLSTQILLTVTEYLLPGILLLTFLYILHLLVLTHRFCGPLVNFQNTFRALGDGDLTARIRLRRRDYLKPEARLFNDMASSIAFRIEAARRIDGRIAEKLEQAIQETETGEPLEQVLRKLKEIRSLARENRRILGNFRS